MDLVIILVWAAPMQMLATTTPQRPSTTVHVISLVLVAPMLKHATTAL